MNKSEFRSARVETCVKLAEVSPYPSPAKAGRGPDGFERAESIKDPRVRVGSHVLVPAYLGKLFPGVVTFVGISNVTVSFVTPSDIKAARDGWRTVRLSTQTSRFADIWVPIPHTPKAPLALPAAPPPSQFKIDAIHAVFEKDRMLLVAAIWCEMSCVRKIGQISHLHFASPREEMRFCPQILSCSMEIKALVRLGAVDEPVDGSDYRPTLSEAGRLAFEMFSEDTQEDARKEARDSIRAHAQSKGALDDVHGYALWWHSHVDMPHPRAGETIWHVDGRRYLVTRDAYGSLSKLGTRYASYVTGIEVDGDCWPYEPAIERPIHTSEIQGYASLLARWRRRHP